MSFLPFNCLSLSTALRGHVRKQPSGFGCDVGPHGNSRVCDGGERPRFELGLLLHRARALIVFVLATRYYARGELRQICPETCSGEVLFTMISNAVIVDAS